MSNQEDPQDFVVANFMTLENQLIQFIEYVPYIEKNQQIFSPKLIPILMDACSLIDSIFRHASPSGERHTFKSYAATHEQRLELGDATMIFLVSPLQFFRPFERWTMSVPAWWEAYNAVKHDRIGNYSAASYLHTVQAMAALHLLLSRSWSFLGNLSKAGWFNEHSDSFAELIASRAAGTGPPDMPAESKLFVSPIRENFVNNAAGEMLVEAWDFSERVKNHIWEHESW